MNRSEIRVGSKVVATTDFDGVAIGGMVGTVLAVPNKSNIPVEFDEEFDGAHDCKGKGAFGYCFYVSPDALRKARAHTAVPSQPQVVEKNTVVIVRPLKNESRKAGGVMKSLSRIMTKLVDADVKSLVEVGWLDSELDVTEEGAMALMEKLFIENKKELAVDAKAILAKKKKGK